MQTSSHTHGAKEQIKKENKNDVLESRSLLGIRYPASFKVTNVITVISTVELVVPCKYFLLALSQPLFEIFDIFLCWKPGSHTYDGGRRRNHQLPFHIRLAFNDCDATQSEQSRETLDSSAFSWC